MKPLYKPKGAAREYGEYAVNIYTGCPHACFYCYCPKIFRRTPEDFFSNVAPRENIVDSLKRQIDKEGITGKLIHLCFVGDPYPTGYDTSTTREVIKTIKGSGNHVQILTKGDGRRDFDLLDENDWYGVTMDGTEGMERFVHLCEAKIHGIKTWVSFEPILDDKEVVSRIPSVGGIADMMKFGKLNYHPSTINWKLAGEAIEATCKLYGYNYCIKESLRKEMNA